MRLHRDYRGLSQAATGAAVVIGNFDGLHRGHRALIERCQAIALEERLPTGLVTFEPHPRRVFSPDGPPFRLTPFRSKLRQIAALGIERLYCLRFNAALYRKPAEAFVAEVLVGGLRVRHAVIGYDFVFGHRRGGSAETLQELGRRHDFAVSVLEAVTHGEDVCSSTVIRKDLEAGRVRRAAELLGRCWEVEGRVRHGQRRGRTIGFPTLNLHLGPTALRPALGVYAVKVGLVEAAATRWLPGVANFGRRPTVEGTGLVLEAHVFDFAGDLYGRRVRIAFVDYLRGERKFPSLDALQTQIGLDSQQARQLLARPEYAF